MKQVLDSFKKYEYVKFIGHVIKCKIDDKDDEVFRIEAYCDALDRGGRFIRNVSIGFCVKRDCFFGASKDLLEDKLIGADFRFECNPQESTFQPFSMGYNLK